MRKSALKGVFFMAMKEGQPNDLEAQAVRAIPEEVIGSEKP